MKKNITLFLVLVLSSFSLKAYAQDPLKEGIALFEKSDYAGALPLLRQAVGEDRNSKKANLYLGEVFLQLKNLDSAEIYLKKALSLDNEMAPAYYGLGQVYMSQKKYPEAIQNYNSAINYDSKSEEYVISLGNTYLASDSLDLAMQAFYKAHDMNDKDPRALEGIADAYKAQNIFDTAIQYYKDALKIDSTNIEVRLKLANAYMKNSDGAGAYEQFKKVSELAPNNSQGQYQAGDLLYVNKRYKDAYPFLEKYHQLVPNDNKGLYELADCAYNAHLYTDAVKYFQEYLSKVPNSLDAKKMLAASFFFQKQAMQSYNLYKSIPIDSMGVRDLVRYGLAAKEISDTTATIDAWERAVEMDSTLAPIENQLAGFLFSVRKYDEAIQYFRKYLVLEPRDIGAKLNMGLCYIASQHFPEAIDTLKSVAQEKPDNYFANRWLALAYSATDSMPQAVDVYDHLIKLALSDTSGTNHSSDLNEAYRYKAVYQIISAAKIQKDRPDDSKKLYEQAFENIQSALKYAPKDTKTLALLAQDLAYMGKIDEACKEIKKGLNAVSKDDPIHEQMIKLQKSIGCE
ncbi:MAG: tetratricopeptide repeat protein [Bacteroidetes bacterium]|nr:tetratricopeptide repeat protein [Bacteroidota bacterium]